MTHTEALNFLEAITNAIGPDDGVHLEPFTWNTMHTAIKAALAQPAQEPVFCEYCGGNDENPPNHCMDCARPQEPVSVTYKEVADAMNSLWNGTLEQHQIAQQMADKKLYTAPQQRPWVGLTEEDREKFDEDQLGWNDLLTAADDLLKEKNT
jgi:hypothetical protein